MGSLRKLETKNLAKQAEKNSVSWKKSLVQLFSHLNFACEVYRAQKTVNTYKIRLPPNKRLFNVISLTDFSQLESRWFFV